MRSKKQALKDFHAAMHKFCNRTKNKMNLQQLQDFCNKYFSEDMPSDAEYKDEFLTEFLWIEDGTKYWRGVLNPVEITGDQYVEYRTKMLKDLR